MMTYPNKLKITQAVLKEIPHDLTEDHKLPIEDVVFNWWSSGRTGKSLRLSDAGYEAFTKAKIAHYDFPLISNNTNITSLLNNPSSFMLMLNKKIKCPFYITQATKDSKKALTIRIYDDKIAMLMTLYGTLQEYLDSIGDTRR